MDLLIRNYRVRGHIIAKIDPLGRVNPRPPELEPSITDSRRRTSTRPFRPPRFAVRTCRQIRAIIQRFEETYCGAIGAQFMHIDDLAARDWLQRRMRTPSIG